MLFAFVLPVVPPQLAPPDLGSQSLPTAVRWAIPIAARPSAPPVIAGGKIFLVMESGVVAARRMSDGSEAWHVDLRTDQSVAVDGTVGVIASGEALHALKTEDGAGLWQAPAGTLTAPLLAKGGWIIAASSAGLAAYRASDGKKIWSRETGPQQTRPTIEGDNLYVPLDDGRLLALDLATGADRWTHRFAAPPPPAAGPAAPALSEVLAFSDRVFLGSSDKWFYALSAVDGTMAWRQRIGATLRGRPVADTSRIFTTSMDNVVRAFDRRSGALLWHPSVPFRPTTGPVLIGTTVVVPGAAAEVRGFEAASGKPAGQITLEAPLGIPPAFGESGEAAVMVAVTGSLTEQWTLLLTEAQRTLPIVPLPALPGVIVPIPSAPEKN